MAEIHLVTAGVTVHNPGQHPLAPGAGQPVIKTGTSVSGQVNASGLIPGPILRNPA
jgi:hypothetical protein